MERETFLQVTGLPRDRPFELEPWRCPVDRRWLVKVRAKGLVDNHMEPGNMIEYVKQLRDADRDLAEKIHDAIAAWREASEKRRVR